MKLLFLILLIICTSVYSQDSVKGTRSVDSSINKVENVKGIIIGISDYSNIQKLKYANNDAISFYNFILQQNLYNVDKNNLTLLLDSSATMGNICSSFMNLRSNVNEGDLVVIYFSGHGDIETLTMMNAGYLLCYNANPNNYPGSDALAVSLLQGYCSTLINEKKCKVILIADACHSGKLSGGNEGAKMTMAALNNEWANTIKLLSCQPGELSREDSKWAGGNGVFTYFLIKGLVGYADEDKDDYISLSELQLYLLKNVPDNTDKQQHPDVRGLPNFLLSRINRGKFNSYKKNEKIFNVLDTSVNYKANEFAFNEDSVFLPVYRSFTQTLERTDSVPLDLLNNKYDLIINSEAGDRLKTNVKAKMFSYLNNKVQKILNELLSNPGKIDWNKFNIAVSFMEKELDVLGVNDPLYNTLNARFLYLKSFDNNNISNEISIKYLEDCIKYEPMAAYAYNRLGVYYFENKEYELSEMNLLKAALYAPNDNYSYYNLGALYFALEDYPKAIIYFDKAINIDSNNPESYNMRGICYYHMKNYTGAINDYNKAIFLDSSNSAYFSNRLNAHNKAMDFKGAIEDYNLLIRLNPESSELYYYRSILFYYRLIEYKLALSDINKAIELEQSNANYYMLRGNIYYDLKIYDKAVTDLEESISLDPSLENKLIDLITSAKKKLNK